jgi:hypothetical protein
MFVKGRKKEKKTALRGGRSAVSSYAEVLCYIYEDIVVLYVFVRGCGFATVMP